MYRMLIIMTGSQTMHARKTEQTKTANSVQTVA
jgi:hypothetical protein